MRALAILFVVIGHGNNLLVDKINIIIEHSIFDGVSMFFVLSGFLIGGILLKTLNSNHVNFHSLLNFWLRRWLRTLPAYFAIMILLAALSLFFVSDFEFSSIKEYPFFLQNFHTVQPDFFPESWSLSVEEWFYIIIPVLLFLLSIVFKIPVKRSFLIVILSVMVFSIAFRYFRYSNLSIHTMKIWETEFRNQVITRLDSIMFGLLGAYLLYYFKNFWITNKNILLAAGLFILIILKILEIYQLNGFGLYFYVFYFSVESLISFLILPYLSQWTTGNGVIYKLITYISIISYSMYLVNLSLVQIWLLKVMRIIHPPGIYYILVNYSLYWLFTISAAFILYKCVEKPMMDLRNKIK